jgi:hypothetical protein
VRYNAKISNPCDIHPDQNLGFYLELSHKLIEKYKNNTIKIQNLNPDQFTRPEVYLRDIVQLSPSIFLDKITSNLNNF